jgi:alpha-L-fucosidase
MPDNQEAQAIRRTMNPASPTRRAFLTNAALLTAAATLRAQTGAPAGAPDAYATPKPDLAGPFQPTWDSLRDNYTTPAWFNQARFGIFIHWGLYSIPARINEWYERHMYTSDAAWHTQHYGSPDKFGYKDFIPLFKPGKYHPAEWADLFANAGAKYVVPVAEHHDGFAMYHSDLTPWCAGRMGPKRDLTGELATAVRQRNLIFGLSSHRMEHAYFAYPAPNVPNDEFDPKYAGFYGPPIKADFNSGLNSQTFQLDWLARVQELVDKYQPQLLYFDNGVNPRAYDTVKLRAAAYYYNRSREWGKQATLATKDVAYLYGTIQDFEKQQRAPTWIYPAAGWQCDDCIGSTWGYTDSPKPMSIRTPESIVHELMELSSQGGNLMLNISPMGDGSIPDIQQKCLLAPHQRRSHLRHPPLVRHGRRPAHPRRDPRRLEGRLHRRRRPTRQTHPSPTPQRGRLPLHPRPRRRLRHRLQVPRHPGHPALLRSLQNKGIPRHPPRLAHASDLPANQRSPPRHPPSNRLPGHALHPSYRRIAVPGPRRCNFQVTKEPPPNLHSIPVQASKSFRVIHASAYIPALMHASTRPTRTRLAR